MHARQDRILLDRALTFMEYDMIVDERLSGSIKFHTFAGPEQPSGIGIEKAERKLKVELREARLNLFTSLRMALSEYRETPNLITDELLKECFEQNLTLYRNWVGDLHVKAQYHKKLIEDTPAIGVRMRSFTDLVEGLHAWVG